MWNFKAPLNITIMTILTLAMTGCLKAGKQDGEYEGKTAANFQVTGVQHEPGPVQNKVNWSIPEKNSYIITACMIDKITRTSVMGHKFRVEGEDMIKSEVADDRSCITWTEDINFEFFVERPKYLKFERFIVGDGVKRGRQKIEFAIDPWSKSRSGEHAEFVWLNQPDALHEAWMIQGSDAVNAFRTQAYGAGHQLMIEDVSMRIDQDEVLEGPGTGLKMIMEMTPHVWLKKLSEDTKKHIFKEGVFSISASIIGTKMDPEQNINLHMTNIGTLNATGGSNFDGDLQASQVKMEDGVLNITFPQFALTHKTTNGNLVLALKVKAVGVPETTLKPFKVLLKLGDFNEWLGNKSPLRIRDLNKGFAETYDEFLATIPVDEEAINAARAEARLKELEDFEFGTFDIQYNSIKPGETATNRTVKYNVRVCVTHPLRGDAKAENEVFYVQTTTMEEKEFTTDHLGCLGWTDEVNHYYYKPERYILNEIAIRHSSGFRKDLKIALNPWDLFATFGQDIQKYPDVLVEIRKQEAWEERHKDTPRKIESRFDVNSFSYTTIKFDYEIKKDLSLNVKKSVLMKIDPEVQRYSSMTLGRRGTEWLRDGIWLLKIAIHKDYLDPAQKGAMITPDGQYTVKTGERISEKHFISYQKKLVRVINGRIVTPVTFQMKDLRLMRIRSNLLIQLEPIDETKLQLANWLKDVLDQRAHLDDRQRGDFEAFLNDLKEFVSRHLGVDEDKLDGDLEDFRFRVNPNGIDYEKVNELYGNYNDPTLSEEERQVIERQRALLGEQEMEAKRQYREQRKNLIDRFLQEIDAVKVREAIHQEDQEGLNRLLHDATHFGRTDEDGDGVYETFPKDVTQVPADTDPDTNDTVPGRIIEGSEARYHFFVQEGNAPIDAGLLMGINRQFNMSEVEMAELALNDFTVNPAAAFFDIEKIIEPPEVSGLRKRTFIGPVTFLLNSNGSHIRPTDTLDEVFCINNSCAAKDVTEQELREWTYEEDKTFMYKRFYNSVAHFFKRHVDDLIICKDGGLIDNPSFCGSSLPTKEVAVNGQKYYEFEGLDALNEREIQARSLISNYIRLTGLEFVSLGDEQLKTVRLDCEFPYYDESCLVADTQVSQTTADAFLHKLDQKDKEPEDRFWVTAEDLENDRHLVRLRSRTDKLAYLKLEMPRNLHEHTTSREELTAFIKSMYGQGGALLSDNVASKICAYMADGYVTRLLSQGVLIEAFKGELLRKLVTNCLSFQKYVGNGQQNLMIMDKKIRVDKTKRYLFKGGKSMNVNVGSSTGIDQKEAKEIKYGLGSVDGTVFSGGLVKQIPLVGSLLGGFSVGLGAGAAAGKSSGLSMNAGTYLVMQNATFDIELQSYEQCLIIKYDSMMLDRLINLPMYLEHNLSDESYLRASIFGVFVCTGELEEPRNPENPNQLQPLAVRERYYYFTQHFTEGDMLDSGDLYNHPWLLMLRGRRDFNIFMAAINGFYSNKDIKLWDWSSPVSHTSMTTYTWPIENLVNTYLDVEPTFPGLYTVLANEPHDFPWGAEQPNQSFQPLNFGLGLGQYQDMVQPGADPAGQIEYEQGTEEDSSILERLVDGVGP